MLEQRNQYLKEHNDTYKQLKIGNYVPAFMATTFLGSQIGEDASGQGTLGKGSDVPGSDD